MTTPIVSVVVPVYQPDPVFFRQSITSVLAQSHRDLELIIVEDPSASSGRALLQGIDDRRLTHIVNPERTSLPRQHNRGLAEARGRFICRFDSDDVCEPGRVERELAFLQAHPDIDVVGSALTVIDERGAVIGTRRYPTDHAAILAAMHRFNPIANSSVMFRREVYEKFGGWRDAPLPAQDYEWYSRLAAGGARFANLAEPLVRYRLHGQSIKSSKLRGTIQTTLEVKNMYWRKEMDVTARAVMMLERVLLHLPESLVLWLFTAIRYRRSTGRSLG
jgi:glycosyltransferase involved in cell wall biosynthesis